jgi:hypothetical protein
MLGLRCGMRSRRPPRKGRPLQFRLSFATAASVSLGRSLEPPSSSGQSSHRLPTSAALESGTDGATQPFWSADGRFLAFHANGNLRKIAVSGGPAQTLIDGLPGIVGGTWNHDGVVLFARATGPSSAIQRVSAAGGAAAPVTMVDASRQETGHLWPHFLPDGPGGKYQISIDGGTEPVWNRNGRELF